MGTFPEDVRAFIKSNIDSVELLNVLLVLRENSERSWTPDEISAELRSSPHSIRRRLAHLHDRRLVVASGSGYRYAASPRRDDLVQRLFELYRERRTTVIDLIFEPAPDPLRSFSDAFRLRGDADDR